MRPEDILSTVTLRGNHPGESKIKSYSNNGGFGAILQEAVDRDRQTELSNREKKDLMKACNEMESLFVAKMFKTMRDNIEKTGWINGGFAEEVFSDMLYDEYAMKVSENSKLGLATMLYDELSRRL